MVSQAAETAEENNLTVSELFYSIQGESTYAGYPCFFIRLSGCNLRCSYCDTAYAYEEEGSAYSLGSLLKLAGEYHHGTLIQITGGEPLLQENVYPLMEKLLQTEKTVLLETNGSVDLRSVPLGVVRIMDLKCPGSGMAEKTNFDNLDLLRSSDELKFVITSRLDYEWARDIVRTRYHRSIRGRETDNPSILFSPAAGCLQPARLAGWILEDRLQVRLQVQLHKILWPGKEKGV